MAAKSVLVVDDDADVRVMYKRALKVFPELSVRACEDGLSALLEIGRETPDLVILDIRMPGLSGFDVCRTLRSNRLTAEVKILAVSGERLKPAEEQALGANIDGWLRKPAPIDALRERVAQLLGIVDFRRGGRAV